MLNSWHIVAESPTANHELRGSKIPETPKKKIYVRPECSGRVNSDLTSVALFSISARTSVEGVKGWGERREEGGGRREEGGGRREEGGGRREEGGREEGLLTRHLFGNTFPKHLRKSASQP
jgi:hypothetical protein